MRTCITYYEVILHKNVAYGLQISYTIASWTVRNEQIIDYAAFKIMIKPALSFRPPQVLIDSFHTSPNKLILMGKLTRVNTVSADTISLYLQCVILAVFMR